MSRASMREALRQVSDAFAKSLVKSKRSYAALAKRLEQIARGLAESRRKEEYERNRANRLDASMQSFQVLVNEARWAAVRAREGVSAAHFEIRRLKDDLAAVEASKVTHTEMQQVLAMVTARAERAEARVKELQTAPLRAYRDTLRPVVDLLRQALPHVPPALHNEITQVVHAASEPPKAGDPT